MKQVHVPALDRYISSLGFGCASLGSRISARHGVSAIASALDLGVTWFDVAPSYGDGQAEAILGRALAGRREQVVICTKFGIPRPQTSLPKRLLRPVAQKAVALFPGLRNVARRAHALGTRPVMDPASLEASVVCSLRLLKTDYIDVLALHEPSLEEATNPRLLEGLVALRERGLVRSLSLAGDPSVISAAVKHRQPDFLQFPDNPFANSVPEIRQALTGNPRPVFITHGVFSAEIGRKLVDPLAPWAHALQGIANHYSLDIRKYPGDFLLAFALSNNPDGVVITSMFDNAHRSRNCQLAGRDWPAELAGSVRDITIEAST